MQFTEDELVTMFSHTDPCFLLKLAKNDFVLRKVILKKSLRDKLSYNLGLPVTNSLKELCDYSKMYSPELLTVAVRLNDIRVFLHMLHKAYNFQDAIFEASESGKTIMLKMLLDHESTEDNLRCAIVAAAKSNRLEVVEMLIFEYDANSDDALSSASSEGHIEIVTAMLKLGVKNQSSVSLALSNALYKGHPEVAKLLIYSYVGGYDKLFINVAESGYVEIMNILNNIGILYVYGAFDRAAGEGHLEMVKLLFTAPPTKYEIKTALESASINGHYDIVKFLLDNGSNPNHALKSAIRGRKYDIIDLLMQYGADNFEEGFRTAVGIGNVKLAMFFLDKNEGTIDLYKCLPLAMAMYPPKLDMIKFLMSEGNAPMRYINDVLFRAAAGGSDDIVQYILDMRRSGLKIIEAKDYAGSGTHRNIHELLDKYLK